MKLESKILDYVLKFQSKQKMKLKYLCLQVMKDVELLELKGKRN